MNTDFNTFFFVFCLWMGGIVSWLFASLFEFIKVKRRFIEQKAAIENQPAEARAIILEGGAKVDDYLRDKGIYDPRFRESLGTHCVRPLMILSFAVLANFLLKETSPLLLALSLIGMLVCVTLTMLHEFVVEKAQQARIGYILSVGALWVCYFFLIWGLVSSTGKKKVDIKPALVPSLIATDGLQNAAQSKENTGR